MRELIAEPAKPERDAESVSGPVSETAAATGAATTGVTGTTPAAGMSAERDGSGTAGEEYADRLSALSLQRWKTALDVQRPYRWNLRRLNLGRVLDVGCGIGRNLTHLGGNGVGVDHNAASIAQCTKLGLKAYTSAEFQQTAYAKPAMFDSMLLAHVLEHVDESVADEIIAEYLPFVRPGGSVVFITPQERGFPTDPTHIRFVDFAAMKNHAERAGLSVQRAYSFPFPRPAGKVFTYNEFVQVARVPE